MRTLFSRALVAAALAAAAAHSALAQNTVTLEGSVKSEGTPVASAQVNIVNTATGERAQTMSRATGEFRFVGLFPGKYTVTVRAVSFRPNTQTVELVIGQHARLEFDMDRG